MNKGIEERLIEVLVKRMNEHSLLKSFDFFDSFKMLWENKLHYYADHNIQSNESKIKGSNQIYCKQIVFDNITFNLEFQVEYLLKMLTIDKNNNTNLFRSITLHNSDGRLNYAGLNCEYSRLSDCEIAPSSSYENLNDVLIVPLPLNPISYVCVDGNHRISSQIKEGKSSIKAFYANERLTVQSLRSSFQACLYCFLFDVMMVAYSANKFDSNTIKENLTIFDDNSELSNILRKYRN